MDNRLVPEVPMSQFEIREVCNQYVTKRASSFTLKTIMHYEQYVMLDFVSSNRLITDTLRLVGLQIILHILPIFCSKISGSLNIRVRPEYFLVTHKVSIKKPFCLFGFDRLPRRSGLAP